MNRSNDFGESMETPEKKKTDGVAKWFFKKLVTTPASWLGLAAGVAAGIPMAGVSGLVAGIFENPAPEFQEKNQSEME